MNIEDPITNLRKRNTFRKMRSRAVYGPLAKSPLRTPLEMTWLEAHRNNRSFRELTDNIPPRYEAKLAVLFLSAIKEDRPEIFRDAIEMMELLRAQPKSGRLIAPKDPVRAEVLGFFSSNPEVQITASALMHELSTRGISVEERTLRRICKEFRLPLQRAKVGRKPRIKDIKENG